MKNVLHSLFDRLGVYINDVDAIISKVTNDDAIGEDDFRNQVLGVL
jgi:hypothetical protein